ncbi:MAG: DUF1178 family protein [Sulfitobacter sp.]|nr:DUF1178 family protein [Sulfitobacter sp.]
MIHYALKCEDGHAFESWFQSAAAFDALAQAGHLSCAVCGSTEVSKAIMAPRVTGGREEAEEAPKTPVLKNPGSEVEKALVDLRKKVEENSDYVGDRFATEARAMHLGDKPERSIYGEAKPEEAKQLVEDGVPLMPLPFMPKNKLS